MVLAAAATLVGTSLVASTWVQRQFFPAADRNQLVVDLRLPEGTHLDTTDRAALVIEQALRDRDDGGTVADDCAPFDIVSFAHGQTGPVLSGVLWRLVIRGDRRDRPKTEKQTEGGRTHVQSSTGHSTARSDQST